MRRTGMTLVEVIVAMTVGAAVMGLLAATITRVIAANASSQDHLHAVVNLGRLGEQFRRDAHAARRADVAESQNAGRLTLQGDGVVVEYEIAADGLRRSAIQGDKPAARETFPLPGLKGLGWRIADDGRIVSLILGRLARPGSDDPALRGQFTLDALVARHSPPAAASEAVQP